MNALGKYFTRQLNTFIICSEINSEKCGSSSAVLSNECVQIKRNSELKKEHIKYYMKSYTLCNGSFVFHL